MNAAIRVENLPKSASSRRPATLRTTASARKAGSVGRAHSGVALLAGLALLAAIALLALVAAANMVLQQRMASNFSDQLRARHTADLATARGQSILFALDESAREADCLVDCFLSPVDEWFESAALDPVTLSHASAAWWEGNAIDAGSAPTDLLDWGALPPAAAETPRFVLQEIHFDGSPPVAETAGAPAITGIGYYRILGRATGGSPYSIGVSETIVARPWAEPETPTEISGTGAFSIDPALLGGDFCAPFRPWYPCGRLGWMVRR